MIHIFDVDNTIIKKTSAWYFLREALSKGVIRFSRIKGLPFDWLKYKLGKPNIDFIEEAVKPIAGIEKGVLEEIARSSFQKAMKGNIYTEAARLINEAMERGEKVIFATSSFYTIIKPLESFFGVENSVASELEFSDNKTTGKIVGKSIFGDRKKIEVEAWLLKNGVSPREACFYSDSYTDLPLLEFCGKAVAVNPDRFLAREAKKRGWEIKRFAKTLGNSSFFQNSVSFEKSS